MKRAVLVLAFVLATSAPAKADIQSDLAAGVDMETVLLNAVSSGKSIVDALAEVLKATEGRDAEIISSAIRLFPDMAVEIVIAALNAGVDVELVVSTAVLTAPDKVAEIVAAAVNLLPEQRDVIVKAAIGSGGDQDVVVRAALAAIWRANSLGGLFPVVDGGQGKGGMPIYNGSPS